MQQDVALTYTEIDHGEGPLRIAMRLRPGSGDKPALVWFSGYGSDMLGTKAEALDAYAGAEALAMVRFDYTGHGESEGAFKDGTISRWLADALKAIEQAAHGRIIIIGSSMGGWLALRAVQELKKRAGGPKVEGLLLLAPAPDFTSELIEPDLKDAECKALAEQGYFEEVSPYGPEPTVYTAKLLDDGRRNRVLNGIIETGCPVHIIQGKKDADVPYAHALKLMSHLPADDVLLTLVQDGDHRLSRPEDIERMLKAVGDLVASAGAG
ncbi:alpha/beta hydrolase [Martelella lutilitoris]|uniref:Palmitoyl-protein thioesterase ABHD10, mitochondrial n=1 Tax=Martelella lutilitoris TaxID=2583532 RepID=A0A5C4JTT3_9HYPH|nr:alpha/beta hydrolase [Martelella lutilitoris]TNB48823.1 alpha/beta hydrolase [Martelella lutilitoris]